jgi:hypothetical protein
MPLIFLAFGSRCDFRCVLCFRLGSAGLDSSLPSGLQYGPYSFLDGTDAESVATIQIAIEALKLAEHFTEEASKILDNE